jgi:hypothetical protein
VVFQFRPKPPLESKLDRVLKRKSTHAFPDAIDQRLLEVDNRYCDYCNTQNRDRFYLQLKEAVSSELVENWNGKQDFNIDDLIAGFYEGYEGHEGDEIESINEQNWGEFLWEMCQRMEVPTDRMDCMLALGEFEWLVIDALNEYQQESSTVVDHE